MKRIVIEDISLRLIEFLIILIIFPSIVFTLLFASLSGEENHEIIDINEFTAISSSGYIVQNIIAFLYICGKWHCLKQNKCETNVTFMKSSTSTVCITLRETNQ